MVPSSPNLATRCGTGRLTAISLAVGLGLLAGAGHRSRCAPVQPAPELSAPIVCEPPSPPPAPAPAPAPRPVLHAADLVGIYHAGRCILTLDASGTYRDSCDHAQHDLRVWAVDGDGVMLVEGSHGLAEHLTFSTGRLVDSSGTTYVITGDVR